MSLIFTMLKSNTHHAIFQIKVVFFSLTIYINYLWSDFPITYPSTFFTLYLWWCHTELCGYPSFLSTHLAVTCLSLGPRCHFCPRCPLFPVQKYHSRLSYECHPLCQEPFPVYLRFSVFILLQPMLYQHICLS